MGDGRDGGDVSAVKACGVRWKKMQFEIKKLSFQMKAAAKAPTKASRPPEGRYK
jgi:hypothetical protein